MREFLIILVLVVLLTALINPLGIWMPTMLEMVLVGAIGIAFVVFAAFVWRERARDEREERIRMMAGRVAFLAGGAVLVAGTLVQVFMHAVDPWLPGALLAMLVAKLGSLFYAGRQN